jgi:hypothetical protein
MFDRPGKKCSQFVDDMRQGFKAPKTLAPDDRPCQTGIEPKGNWRPLVRPLTSNIWRCRQ